MGKDKYLEITADDYALAKTDMDVFNKIYKANAGLIGYCVMKCSNMKVNPEELDNAMVDGLISAIQNYDPSKNSTFSTYAMCCMIHNAILLQKRTKNSKDVLGQTPLSLDATICDEYENFSKALKETVSDGSFEEEKEKSQEEKVDINRLLSFLPPNKRQIFSMYIGEGKKQYEVAEMLGCSRAYIWRVTQDCIEETQEIAKKSLDVNSMLVSKISPRKIVKMLKLKTLEEVNFYSEIYKYLYDGVDNMEIINRYERIGIKDHKIYPNKSSKVSEEISCH